MIRRTITVGWLVALLAGLGAPPALADPPGPSDYRSTVIDIDPPSDAFEIQVIGGDSFVRLISQPGRTIDVIGYGGEPYLRFLPDGTVLENQRSPSRYVNEDRYAVADVPESASTLADPEWLEVADDASYSWHDHRTHWMNPHPPPGAEPGERILEGVVPLFVDGAEVDVTVASEWEEMGFPWSTLIGALLGFLAGMMAIRAGRLRVAATLTLAIAVLALSVSVAAYLAVPTETGPSWLMWAVPLTACLLTVPATLGRRPGESGRSRPATAVLVAALELFVWGLVRWDWMFAAILPTSLVPWIDRLVVGMAIPAGLLITAGLVVTRLESLRPVRSQ